MIRDQQAPVPKIVFDIWCFCYPLQNVIDMLRNLFLLSLRQLNLLFEGISCGGYLSDNRGISCKGDFPRDGFNNVFFLLQEEK